jgi:hypothetical protein
MTPQQMPAPLEISDKGSPARTGDLDVKHTEHQKSMPLVIFTKRTRRASAWSIRVHDPSTKPGYLILGEVEVGEVLDLLEVEEALLEGSNLEVDSPVVVVEEVLGEATTTGTRLAARSTLVVMS